MSKRIIAGLGVVAGLAVALAPVATFADTPNDDQVDTLVVNIESACEFGHDFEGSDHDVTGVAHTGGTATWNDTTNDDDPGADRAYATMEAGTTASSFATTTLKVYCNATSGYTLKVEGSNLTSGVPADDITPAATIGTTSSNWNFTPTSTDMTFGTGYATNTAAAAPTSEATLATGDATPVTGDTLSVVYGVGLKSTQPSGTYVGTMTYNLYAN